MEGGAATIRRNGEYPLTDGHGSSRTLTDANQSVTGTADYAAFGQVAGTTGTSAEPYLYAGAWGYRSDGDAGLMLVGARYHDAQAGRFVTRDTLLSEHPYLYCEHEPVGCVDPSGHWPDWKKIGTFLRLLILFGQDPEPDPIEIEGPPPQRIERPIRSRPRTGTGPRPPGAEDGDDGGGAPRLPALPPRGPGLSPSFPWIMILPGDDPWERPGSWLLRIMGARPIQA